MPIIGRKWIFWTNFGHLWAKNPNIYGSKYKSFGTQIMEKPPRQLVRIVFGQAIDQMSQKCRYLATNASFGPRLAVLGPKFQFLGGREYNFWYHHIRTPMRHLFGIENIKRGSKQRLTFRFRNFSVSRLLPSF